MVRAVLAAVAGVAGALVLPVVAEAQKGCDVPLIGVPVADKISIHATKGVDKSVVVAAASSWNRRCGGVIPTVSPPTWWPTYQRWYVEINDHLLTEQNLRTRLARCATVDFHNRKIYVDPDCDDAMETILTHEIGHVLGLADINSSHGPECAGNIMWNEGTWTDAGTIGAEETGPITAEVCLGVREAWKGIDSETPFIPGGGDRGGRFGQGAREGGADPGDNDLLYVDCDENPSDPACGTVTIEECWGVLVQMGEDANDPSSWVCIRPL